VKFDELKKGFIRKSVDVVESTITKNITRELTQLKEDIKQARNNDFGRRLFEAFSSEYAASHLNEKSETAKLRKAIQEKELELEEAAKIVAESQKLVESKETQIKIARDLAERKEILGELLGPLTGEKKSVMKELLESVQTDKLISAYDKYLPAVMEGTSNSTKKRKTITEATETKSEAKEVTGDKEAQTIGGEEKTAEIFDIRRLAGLKV
jgi:hypothetical protein